MEKLKFVNAILVKDLNDIREFIEKNPNSDFELFKTKNGFVLSMYACFTEMNFESLAYREYDLISTANANACIKNAGIKILPEDRTHLAFCEDGKLIIEELKELDVFGNKENFRFRPYNAFKVPFYVNKLRTMNIAELKDFKWNNFIKKVEEESAK